MPTFLRHAALCTGFAALLLAPAATALELHVAPKGDDAAGDGSAGKPFASPQRAVAALTERKSGEAAQILLHAGTYPVGGGLRLGAAQSGAAAAPVVVRAAGDGAAILSGALRIPPAAVREVTDPETLARLPGKRDPGTRLFEIRLADLGLAKFPALLPHGWSGAGPAWPQLLQDGTALPLAAWPDGEGYAGGFKPLKILSAGTKAKIVAGGAASTGQADAAPMVFTVEPARAARWKAALERHHAALWIGGHWFWDWADDCLPVAAIGGDGAVTMGKKHPYGLGEHVNLHAYNLAEEMDRAGEYALEPANGRILVLLDPKDNRNLALTWSQAPAIALANAAHLRFEDLRVEDLRGDAAQVKGSEDIVFDHCAFTGIGGTGAAVEGGKRVVFTDCLFAHLGAGGVKLAGGDRRKLAHSDHAVDHCLFEDFGRLKRTYAPAVQLSGVGAQATDCLIRQGPHSAILFSGNEHLIARNEITRVLTETGDCGAIYGGRDWTAHGTVIENNWIHDLGGVAGRWACGIYLDDQLSGITVKGNWVDHAELGMLLGGGRYNQVTGNLLSHCKQGISADARGTTWAKEKFAETLRKRLAEVLATEEPWKSRYPMLARTLEDHPEKPVGTRVVGNAMVGCKKPWLNHADGGAAVLAPNFEKLPETALRETRNGVEVAGTPLRFVKPVVGPQGE